jgi:hypothetical protein
MLRNFRLDKTFNSPEMDREDDKRLWDLLGKSETPRLSPFFARNVVREIRQTPSWQQVVRDWLVLRRVLPATAVALALCLAAAFNLRPKSSPAVDASQDDVPEVVAKIDPSDYEVVADLDDLLAAQEDDSWDETSTL